LGYSAATLASRCIDRCRLLNWTDPEYPQTLLQIYDPPVMLYVRGGAEVLNLPSISIVGTRRPTLYGTQMVERLGRELAARGLVVVSGMARGIDAIGHQGALAGNGRAIGVLGTGVDVCYPKENKKLYEKVLERGALISEFPLGTHPAPENFPVRNRIVAGLPRGVVVVEGAQYSGSLITARLAMEFGREVFGVPGNATQPVSFASNQFDQAGREAGDQWCGCDRGAAYACARRVGAGGATGGGAAESAGRGVAQFVGKEDLRPAEHGRPQAH
jgi:DNA processing protein